MKIIVIAAQPEGVMCAVEAKDMYEFEIIILCSQTPETRKAARATRGHLS